MAVTQPTKATTVPGKPATEAPAEPPHKRLVSLDAYRGFVMLAMASSGLAIASVLKKFPEVLDRYAGTPLSWWWEKLWLRGAYQLDHVEWTGCAFWDLIQPSFMFMVGVALPFSFSRRSSEGQSRARLFGHVLFRSLILVLLGVFLSSTGSKGVTNFTFVNVLTQIGLGYPFLCLLMGCRARTLLVHATIILVGYWAAFYFYTTPQAEYDEVTTYLKEVKHKDEKEWKQFEGLASHWNKHTNFAAAVDRRLLNLFPRNEEPWHGKGFWINDGGYATLNFIPSLATMIFGLMAGQLLFSSLWDGSPDPSPAGSVKAASAAEANKRRVGRPVLHLLLWGGLCFVVAMAADTTIWPFAIKGCNWSLCPAVKRIWTPTWAVFSAGWCFWMLAGFYLVCDVWGWRKLAFPLAIVGMNSIAIYCLAQTLKPWLLRMLVIHGGTIDAVAGTQIASTLTSEKLSYAPILMRIAEVSLLWLIMLWMYRRRIFVRV